MKKFLPGGILFILLLCSCFNISAQTKGLIYKKAANAGQEVLDPNLDGYTSKTNQGFDLEDELESEIPYTPLPSLGAAEPDSDLGPGPNCSFTDLVKSEDNNTIYTYLDANENLMFRFRLGGTAENSKAYSILIDTDQKFGSSGANADPNYRQGNPGFEIEVVLMTNFGVGLYDVDGRIEAVEIGDAVLDRPYDNFAQKSIAHSEICGDDDYFYDFYIPFSDITAAFSSVTVNTPLRMVGNTVINPNEAIGNNGISDLGGIDDTTGITDDLWEQLIDSFPPTSVSEIGTGSSLAARAECPAITGPVNIGETSISGTSSEVDGAIIEVFKNGSFIGTTTVNSGNWTLTGITPTQDGEIITASARVSESVAQATNTDEKSESYSDCNETEVGSVCTDAPLNFSLISGNKGFTGTTNGSAGTIIRIYKYPEGTLWTTADETGNPVSTVVDNETWQVSGKKGQSLPDGTYYATAEAPGQCESKQSLIVCKGLGGSAVPSITTDPILVEDSVISGTSGANANIQLFIDKAQSSFYTTADGSGNWTLSGISGLEKGQSIIVLAADPGMCPSESAETFVVEQSKVPYIQGNYCSSSGSISSISGISSEVGGTINIYTSATSPVSAASSIGTATVQANGSWTANVSITAGTFVAATVTNTNELESELSNQIQIYDQTVDNSLAITSDPIAEGDASISGTGTSGNEVFLYLDN